MTYPLSFVISPGDPTLASQYNNLRSDALFLGQAPADAVSIGQFLERYESRLQLVKLNTAQVRVPATVSKPVSLFVDGYLLQAQNYIDLPSGSAPNGSGTWYVFANRSAGNNSFTLSISTSSTESTGKRRIGSFYFDGTTIVRDSIRTELSESIADLLYFQSPIQAGGRLTLSTGAPVPSGNIESASSLFYTPHIHNRVSLYVPGFGWRLYTFEELSLSLTSFTANKNYDIFLYNDEGELKLQALAWSNDTLRATALARQNGVLVKYNSSAYLYLGTLRTLASGGASADCDDKRFVWNCYNRVERTLKKIESETSWTYAASSWRPLNNNSSNKVEFVIGYVVDPVYLQHFCHVSNSSSGGQSIGIALDCSNTNSADIIGYSSIDWVTIVSIFRKMVPVGYHYLQLVEWASAEGTSTFCSRISTLSTSCSQWGGLGCLKA